VVVRTVASGEVALPRALVRELRVLRGTGRARLERDRDTRLSGREWEVLALLDAGLGTSDVADRLGVSPVMIRRHVARAVEQLGAAERAEALAMLRGSAR